jgi:hypothetical protein
MDFHVKYILLLLSGGHTYKRETPLFSAIFIANCSVKNHPWGRGGCSYNINIKSCIKA